MTNYTKKSSAAGGSFNKRSTRRYDGSAVTSVELIKQDGRYSYRSADASVLSTILSTYYDGASHTGVISPHADRVMHLLNWGEMQFASALAILIKSKRWQVPLGTDSKTSGFDLAELETYEIRDALLSYGVSNIGTYICRFLDEAKANKHELKQQKMSLNHAKCISRYSTRLSGDRPAGLALGILNLVVSRTPPKFNDLGHQWFTKNKIEPVHVVQTSVGPRKFFHSVLFDHPMMEASQPPGWEYLASIKNLTQEMTSNPRSVCIQVKELQAKFGLPDNGWSELWAAVEEIRANGLFSVTLLERNPYNRMDATLLFVPRNKLHDLVWGFDLYVGGKNQTVWEAQNGFLPVSQLEEGDDPMVSLPKAGYHWLYLLKRRKTGEYLSAGQTSMTAEMRLWLHRTEGTNSEVDAIIRDINNDIDDELQIEVVGAVHHWSTAEYEMKLLWKMQELGHRLLNKIVSVEANRRTIHVDARLKQLDHWEQDAFLENQLQKYGPVLFQKELPLLTSLQSVNTHPQEPPEAPRMR